MVGPWYTTQWRLVSQSHGAVAWRFRSPIPSHVPSLFATSCHRPILSVPWFLYPPGLVRGPIPSLIPCLYPTGPPATLWRGPTGCSSIRGPFRAPSTGRSLPAPAPFPCAASRHPSRPISHTPHLPIHLGLFRGPSHTPFSVPSPFPIVPCLYPTGPPATLWRGPTGSSSILGPCRAPSTGRSLPVFPVSRPVTHLGLFPASRAFPFSWGRCAAPATRPSLSRPLLPSSRVYTTGLPATLWCGPTGSSSIRGPFRVPSTGRSLPAPFRLGGVFPSGPVLGPSSWHLLPPVPVPFPHLVTCCCCFFFPRATRGLSSARLLLPVPPLPARSVLYALRWCCGVLFFFWSAPSFPAVHPALWFPPPCMHAHQHCSGHLATAPLGALLLSHRPLGAWPLAVLGHARWAPLPRVSLLSPLSSLPSLLSLVRPLTVVLLLRVLSAGRPRARAVSRALSRASGPPPCPPTCRLTWAASPDTPSGELPRRPPPPAFPPSVP